MCLVRLDQECAELGVIGIAVFQSMVTLRRTISTRSRPMSNREQVIPLENGPPY